MSRYDNTSNVWDLGVLLYRILNGGVGPEIDYNNKSIKIDDALIEDQVISDILYGCLEFDKMKRITV